MVNVTKTYLPDFDDYTRILRRAWDKGWITNNGDLVRELEESLRKYLGVEYLLFTSNGTLALQMSLKALNVTKEVITTAFSYVATTNAILWEHCMPVFADINRNDYCINADEIENLITENTQAILATHVYGLPCNIEKIETIASRYDLKVIYDGAHAFGTRVNGVGIGTFGDITMLSFHATKLFHTAEGGALACRDEAMRERINQLKNFGIIDPETVLSIGLNGKMNELQAVLGLAVLDCLAEEIDRRKALLQLYRRTLGAIDGVTMVEEPPGIESSYQYCAIRIDEARFGCSRDGVHRALMNHNVISRKYFFPLCSDYACYRDLPSADPARLPVARTAAMQVLCLPLYGSLPPETVQCICDIIASCRGGAS